MFRVFCFGCSIAMFSIVVSHIFSREWSNLFCICITTWVVLDRIFVNNSVLEETISELRQDKAKLLQEVMLLKLKHESEKTKYWRHVSMMGSSCHF
jgi:hypothetical protein